MRLVVIGLSLSSSWGNGHATTFRALLRAFAARGHEVLFIERDQPWYAAHRDLPDPDFAQLEIIPDLAALSGFTREIAQADAVMLGSFADINGSAAAFLRAHARGVTAFYDIDTPVTLEALEAGACDYLHQADIPGFDVYLSFTGGPTLSLLERRWGARRARALYCSVDPAAYPPLDMPERWALSYLGTYSEDRQPGLERLLIAVAAARPDLRFAVAGSLYPDAIAWPDNVERIEHLPPADHPGFYAASRLTLNLTRAAMRKAGWSPSVRLFEAGAVGRPIISDVWPGLGELLEPEREILLAETTADVLAALDRPDLARIGERARARVLAHHSAAARAAGLEAELSDAAAASTHRCVKELA